MSGLDKLIVAASSPGAETVGKVVEVTGKGSMAAGPAAMAIEKVAGSTFTVTEYAAMLSMVGTLVWIAKLLFDGLLNYLRYRRGD